MTGDRHIVVIGAGVGGLSAAADLARRGFRVTVLERATTPGGKMRRVAVGGAEIDGGPTVFTMRWIFDGLFADAGQSLADRLDLVPADILARHAWRKGGRLDLFADINRSADAIGDFAGAAEAHGYIEFCRRSAQIFATLKGSFIAAERPSPVELVSRVGWRNLEDMWRTAPMKTLWQALGDHFRDPRLRQLFGRYATYCGCSPFLAPATLMLVAHVEQDGVWLVPGGMRKVAEAIADLGASKGAVYRYGAEVAEILVERGRASGVRLASGERIAADAVVFNGDVAALARALLGSAASKAAPDTSRTDRSLSAITWCVNAPTSGFPLVHHNVFFAEDYRAEFDAVFRDRTVTAAPTVYICAQDRGADVGVAAGAAERLLVLINAPADGDVAPFDTAALTRHRQSAWDVLRSCGLQISDDPTAMVATDPAGFNALFPGTGGALYGRAGHGATATFARPGAASRLPGLYLAGGSAHPGPGIPMAAMSGRLAAARLAEDIATGGKRRGAISLPTG